MARRRGSSACPATRCRRSSPSCSPCGRCCCACRARATWRRGRSRCAPTSPGRKPDRRREFLRVRRNDAGGLDLFGQPGLGGADVDHSGPTAWSTTRAAQAIAPGDTVRYLSLRGAARMKLAVRYFASRARGARQRRGRSRSATGATSPALRDALVARGGRHAEALGRQRVLRSAQEPRPLRRGDAARRGRRGRLLPAGDRRLKDAHRSLHARLDPAPRTSTSAPKSRPCAPATAASARSARFIGTVRDRNDGAGGRDARARALPRHDRGGDRGDDRRGDAPLRDPRRARRPPRRRARAGRRSSSSPSPRRTAAQAFQACEFLMDYLKTQAPFWKKEAGPDGGARWVDARVADDAALARWGIAAGNASIRPAPRHGNLRLRRDAAGSRIGAAGSAAGVDGSVLRWPLGTLAVTDRWPGFPLGTLFVQLRRWAARIGVVLVWSRDVLDLFRGGRRLARQRRISWPAGAAGIHDLRSCVLGRVA